MGIYGAKGRSGKLITGTLPSGDLTLNGSGDRWYLDLARSIAKANGGKPDGQYGNWIIPKQYRQRAIDSVQSQCDPVKS